MSLTVTSLIPGIVAGAQPIRKADALSVPFPSAPQAMTIYVRFRESGNAILAGSVRVLHIGNSSLAAPNLQLQFPAGGTGYRLSLVTLSGTVNVSLGAKPGIGEEVELRATITAAGVIQLGQSLNGAAEAVTGTATAVLPQTWSDTKCWIGGLSGGTAAGAIALRNLLIVRGVQSLQTMRKYAGVA